LDTLQSKALEQALLAHVAMCHAVALALTHDNGDAGRLTQEVVAQVWNSHAQQDHDKGIKTELLTTLRERYLNHYREKRLLRREESIECTTLSG